MDRVYICASRPENDYRGDIYGVLHAADGTELWSHVSSGPGFLHGDLTTTFLDRREALEQRYPDGYLIIWLAPGSPRPWLAPQEPPEPVRDFLSDLVADSEGQMSSEPHMALLHDPVAKRYYAYGPYPDEPTAWAVANQMAYDANAQLAPQDDHHIAYVALIEEAG